MRKLRPSEIRKYLEKIRGYIEKGFVKWELFKFKNKKYCWDPGYSCGGFFGRFGTANKKEIFEDLKNVDGVCIHGAICLATLKAPSRSTEILDYLEKFCPPTSECLMEFNDKVKTKKSDMLKVLDAAIEGTSVKNKKLCGNC